MAVQTPDPQFFAIEVKAVFFKNCIPDTEGDLCFVQKLFSLPELGLLQIKMRVFGIPQKRMWNRSLNTKRGLSRSACGDILFAEKLPVII